MISSGVPDSIIRPLSKNNTLSATCATKDISWLTSTMVCPDFAALAMDFSTSPTNSGSKAEVGSSSKRTSGFMAKARAKATRCFCPPER